MPLIRPFTLATSPTSLAIVRRMFYQDEQVICVSVDGAAAKVPVLSLVPLPVPVRSESEFFVRYHHLMAANLGVLAVVDPASALQPHVVRQVLRIHLARARDMTDSHAALVEERSRRR